jgi:hypothetical protein
MTNIETPHDVQAWRDENLQLPINILINNFNANHLEIIMQVVP